MLINLRNGMMGGKKSPLPPGARWVEYLESDGSAYINIGRDVGADFWVDAVVDRGFTSSVYRTVLGARIASGNGDYQVSFHENNLLVRYGPNNRDKQYYAPVSSNVRIQVTAERDVIINGVQVATLGYLQPSLLPLAMFALNNNGTISQIAQGMKIYSLKWGNSSVQRDFRPIAIGTTGYMLDLVSGEYLPYGNKGTGDFTIGPDIPSPV